MNKTKRRIFVAFSLLCVSLATRADTESYTMVSHKFSPNLYYTPPSLSVLADVSIVRVTTDSHPETVLSLQVSNDGDGTAYDVTCYLDYTAKSGLNGKKAVIGTIPPGTSRQTEFTITELNTAARRDTITVALTERYGHFPDIVKVLPTGDTSSGPEIPIVSEANPYCIHFPEHIQSNNRGTTKALLFGNRLYHDPLLLKREYAIQDVRAVGDFLAGPAGCSENAVMTYYNIGFKDMNLLFSTPDSLTQHLGNPTLKENLFIYFNGYGFISDEERSLYLAPVDCPFNSKEIPLRGYPLVKLYKLLGQVCKGTVTLVLDITILDPSGMNNSWISHISKSIFQWSSHYIRLFHRPFVSS